MKSPRFLSVLLLFLLPLCIGMISCKTGRPVRKTLPDQLSGEGFSDKFWENSGSGFGNGTKIAPDLPFYAPDTKISEKDFTAIDLRDPQYDSLAASIIKSYEPFA